MAKIFFSGNVTKNVSEMTTGSTSNGNNYIFFNVAESKSRRTDNGQWETEWTVFHPCVAWNNWADIVSQNVSKGTRVYVEGELQGKPDWTDSDGTVHRNQTQIVVRSVSIIPRNQNNNVPVGEPNTSRNNNSKENGGSGSFTGNGGNSDPWQVPDSDNTAGWTLGPDDKEPEF